MSEAYTNIIAAIWQALVDSQNHAQNQAQNAK